MYTFPNFEPVCCSMSSSDCWFLTCIQVSQEADRWSGIPISLRIFHSFLWSTSQWLWFSIVNEAEVGVFLKFSCFFHDPMYVGNLISSSSAFSKSSWYIWKFLVHVLLKPSLKNSSITLLSCESAAFDMPANLENSAVATGLEKVSFHSNPK